MAMTGRIYVSLKMVVKLVLILGFCYCLLPPLGNPFHELALIRRGLTVPGMIEEEWWAWAPEDSWGKVYRYKLPDGRELVQYTPGKQTYEEYIKARNNGEFSHFEDYEVLNTDIQVEYLPNDPIVSRIKGDGCQTIFEFIWRKVVIGGVLFVVIGWLCVSLIRGVIQGKRKNQAV